MRQRKKRGRERERGREGKSKRDIVTEKEKKSWNLIE